MALRDRAVKALRNVFGAPQAERAKADSPSVAAMRHHVPSMFTVWGREDIGGLLTVSQSLMDRFADYEAMEEYPDINSAFHYFANDATQPSVKDGRCIWVQSEDSAIKGLGDDLMHRTLRVEDEIWPQAYGLGMMGNDYLELLITENGVVGTNTLPVPTMRRVERLDGGLIGFVQDVTGQFTANSQELRRMLAGNVEIPRSLALFEDWQVAHFRLRATRRRIPYGVSVAEGARWIWKRLVMLEDSVLIYKLTRAPARYAYYIDTTDVPSDQVGSFLQKAKRDLKKKRMVNPRSGRLDLRYNPLARDEDFFIAVREGRELARVDVLSGPDYQAVDDVEYFKQMLHATLKVPRAYLGKDEAPPSKSILSNDDVRAARVTLNLQRELKIGWERIIRTHLAARGVRDPWKPEFTIEMTIPSGIWELSAYETLNAAADYASRIQPWVSTRWIQEKILKFSEEEIKEIEKQQKKDSEEEQSGDLPSYAMGGAQGGPPEAPPPGGEEEPEEPAPEEKEGEEEEGTPKPKPAPKPAPKPRAPAVGKSKKATPEEMKRWDYERRLEEWKYRESNRRHAEIMDKLGQLTKDDPGFARRDRERRAFFEDVRGLLRRTNGGGIAVPPGGKFSRKELLSMSRRFHGR